MNTPQIRYCRTSDGVRIAFARAGSGVPALVVGGLASHILLDWEHQPAYRMGAQLADLIWYDSRGHGLSERTASDFSIDSMVRDLQAVVDANGLDRFALVAVLDGGPVGVTYASQNPDRVTHLVLINAWVTAADYQQTIAYQIEEALRNRSTSAWLEALALVSFPDSPEDARRFVAEAPQRIDLDVLIRAQKEQGNWDAEPYLSSVVAPTLVIASPTSPWIPPSVAQRVAALIPDCRLVFGDIRSANIALQVAEFALGAPVDPRRPPTAGSTIGETSREIPAGTAIILFADIVDSTALTERLGDAAFREKARDLDTALRTIIRENSGTPIEGKLLGDGVLAVFTSARQAIEAALACGRVGEDGGLPLHLGLHAGDVIHEDDPDGRSNVYGGAVNIASRISGLSVPGEVLVSETVRSLARTSAGVTFEDRGEQALKGVGEKVRVWAVVEGE